MTEHSEQWHEPDDIGCGDDTEREIELEGPLDEPPFEEVEVRHEGLTPDHHC